MYGHSMGAGSAIATAEVAKRYSIKAVVAQHPGNYGKINISNVQCPIMLTGGSRDTVCPKHLQETYYDGITQEKALVILRRAKHWEPCHRSRSLEIKLTGAWLR